MLPTKFEVLFLPLLLIIPDVDVYSTTGILYKDKYYNINFLKEWFLKYWLKKHSACASH